MMTFIPIAASVISFIEVPRRNEVCLERDRMEDFFVCRRKGVCAVARYFLIYALSLRLLCSMNKIKIKNLVPGGGACLCNGGVLARWSCLHATV